MNVGVDVFVALEFADFEIRLRDVLAAHKAFQWLVNRAVFFVSDFLCRALDPIFDIALGVVDAVNHEAQTAGRGVGVDVIET